MRKLSRKSSAAMLCVALPLAEPYSIEEPVARSGVWCLHEARTAMNDFDQAARFEVKVDPQAHIAWLFPRASRVMEFHRWLDSQSAPRAGEPDRRCDTIAELIHREGLTHPRALVIELFTAADADALDRTGEYLWRFRRELRHGPHGRDKYPFVAAMIFLTGLCAERRVVADLPDEDDLGNVLTPRILEMEAQDAVVFLDDVEQNRLSPALLPWTVLMKKGQTAETAKRWGNLSLRLTEPQRRDAAGLAWTFCDLTDCRPVWKPVLEALHMNESIAAREWRDQGRLESRRDDLIEVLRTKFSGDQLATAIARVEKQDDLAILSRWFKLSVTLSPRKLLAELNK
jgi:hypothetical protein